MELLSAFSYSSKRSGNLRVMLNKSPVEVSEFKEALYVLYRPRGRLLPNYYELALIYRHACFVDNEAEEFELVSIKLALLTASI